MANALITPSVIAKEALMQLENNLVFGSNVHREYKKEFAKVGDTVSIRKPVKFAVTDGATASVQDVTESTTPFVINKRKHVAWAFTTQDLTLTVDEYSTRYIQPAMIQLANQVDADLAALYKDVWNAVGTAGTTPSTFAGVAAAAKRLDKMAVPQDMRKLVLDPEAHWSLADGLKGIYNQKRVEEFIGKGYLGNIADFDIFKDQNVSTHTKGTATGTPLVNGGSQSYTAPTSAQLTANTYALITDGWTNSVTGIVKAGDVFTIAGVYSVNPISKQSTAELMQFTVTADANSGAATGPATITVSPAIISAGPYQNVTAAPADNVAITVVANHTANLAFHKNAFGLVTVPLELPDGVSFKAREQDKGISVRVIKDYDFTNDKDQIRIDILYGVKSIYPDLACRLLG